MLLTWKDFTGEQLFDEWLVGIVFAFLLVPILVFVSYMASKFVVCCSISISDIQNIYDEEESDEEEHGKTHDKTSPQKGA